MKVYVLMESKYGGSMQFAGVYATRAAAAEAVLDTVMAMDGAGNYTCNVYAAEIQVGNTTEDEI